MTTKTRTLAKRTRATWKWFVPFSAALTVTSIATAALAGGQISNKTSGDVLIDYAAIGNGGPQLLIPSSTGSLPPVCEMVAIMTLRLVS